MRNALRVTGAGAIVLGLSISKPIKALACDPTVPIRIDGAEFSCHAEFKNGDRVPYKFRIDRDGRIQPTSRGPTQGAPRIKKTADPWGD